MFYCEDSNGIYKRIVYGRDERRRVLVAVLHGGRVFSIDDVHVDAGRGSDSGHARVVAGVGRSRVRDAESGGESLGPISVDAHAPLGLHVQHVRVPVPEHGAEVVRALADDACHAHRAAGLDV